MQPLDINLSSQPFRNNTLLWTGFGLGALLVLWFSVWNASTWLDSRNGLEEMRSTLGGMDTQLKLLEQRKRKAERLLDQDDYDLERLTLQSTKANEVISWKAFSWTRLFNRLERVQPWNVHMVSVRPIFHAERRSRDRSVEEGDETRAIPIAVDGYAKDLGALLAFERALFADPNFDEPEPERHAPDDRGEILFTLRFTYYPAGRATETAAEAATDEPQGAAPEGSSSGDEPPAGEPTAGEVMAGQAGPGATPAPGGPEGAAPGVLAVPPDGAPSAEPLAAESGSETAAPDAVPPTVGAGLEAATDTPPEGPDGAPAEARPPAANERRTQPAASPTSKKAPRGRPPRSKKAGR